MNVGNVATTSTTSTAAKQTLSSNYDTFLKLLTTQLQNQDPLSPADATKFTEQLVSYSQVEQQIATNTNLSSLISITKAAAGANAVSYLGKQTMTAGNVSSLTGGEAKWQYTLPTDANGMQIKVVDASGTTVRTLTGDKTVGKHELAWDGKNSAGAQMPDGTYKLVVAATKADGSAMSVTTSGLGTISEIDMSGAEPVLYIGTRKLTLADITGFKN
jgi:flagellar basal-body rod modification protein FlgD